MRDLIAISLGVSPGSRLSAACHETQHKQARGSGPVCATGLAGQLPPVAVMVVVPAMPTVMAPVMTIAVVMVPAHFRHRWPRALLNRSGAWIDQGQRLRTLGRYCQDETGTDRREAQDSHQLHGLGSSIAMHVAPAAAPASTRF